MLHGRISIERSPLCVCLCGVSVCLSMCALQNNDTMSNWRAAFTAAGRGDVASVAQAVRAYPTRINDFAEHETIHRGQTLLTIAARKGYLKMARILLKRGADARARDELDDSPLHHAARSGHEEMVALLLSNKADIRRRGKGWKTPLILACGAGHLGAVQRLCQDLETTDLDKEDEKGKTALHYAAAKGHAEVVSFLLSRGADSSIMSLGAETPLMLAIDGGHMDVVKLLLEHTNWQGLQDKDEDGDTLLHVAVQQKDTELVTLLLSKGALALSKDGEGRTPLMLAVQLQLQRLGDSSCMEIVKTLLEHMDGQGLEYKDKAGDTALHEAVQGSKLEMVRLLLACGASPVTKDGDGETPLIVAINKGRLKNVRALVEHMEGRGLEVKDGAGRTALHLAVQACKPAMVTLLLSAGASAVNDKRGETPLLLAISNGRMDIAELVLRRMGGRGLESKDREGRTALHLAVDKTHASMVSLLLREGAQAVTSDKHGETPLLLAVKNGHMGIVQLLLPRMDGGLEAKDEMGKTALHLAVCDRKHEMARLLLSAGAHPLARDDELETALMLAVKKGYVDIAELLLEHMPADGLEWKDSEGRTALHLAAEQMHAGLVTLLLSAGADTTSNTSAGATPLMLAAVRGHLGVVDLLLEHMDERGLQDRDAWGATALHYALYTDTFEDTAFEVMRALLFAGVPYTGVDEQQRTPRDVALQKNSSSCVELIDWFAAQHGNTLFRARCLHDANVTHAQLPTAPLPFYMAQRAAMALALPRVQIMTIRKESGAQDGAGRKRKRDSAGEETVLEERDEKRRAMADFVVTNLSTELFNELLDGFEGRGQFSGPEPVLFGLL